MEESSTCKNSTLCNSSFTSNTSDALHACNFTQFEELWGPQRDPLYMPILVTVMLCLVLITGFIGNIVTIYVIARHKALHTATNFYLGSLAVSDLLLLLTGFPQEVYLTWYKYPYIFGEIFCQLRGMIAETTTNASILTIVAFTIERYFAICHPLKAQTMSRLSRVLHVIVILWVAAIICAIPQVLQTSLVFMECGGYVHKKDLYSMCAIIPNLNYSFESSTIIFFLLPMVVITLLYIKIGIRLNRQSAKLQSAHLAKMHKTRKSIFRMLGK